MPYPVQTFSTFDQLLTYINNTWITNGNQEITGVVGNNVVNGLLTFIRQSPLNYSKTSVESSGGDVAASTPVVVFTGTTPDSLSFSDNIYFEYVFLNMTGSAIPLAGSQVYYTMNGDAMNSIPANSAVTIFKSTNDLWVLANSVSGGGSGTVTSFSAGNLSPLFTTSVTNATTIPALSFALTNAAGGTVFGNNGSSAAAPSYTATPVLGISGTSLGTIGLAGNTSGSVTIKPQPAAGTFNFNLPITAGTSGYFLTSGGGGATPMSWTQNNFLTAITADSGVSVSTVSNVQLGSDTSTGSPLLRHTYLYGANTFTLNLNALRFEINKGANIVGGTSLTLGLDGNIFTITGNAQINAITTANWQAGSQIVLLFTDHPLVKNNTAGGAGTATILLSGLVDFQSADGDVLSLLYDGTNWRETNRALASGGGSGSVTSVSSGNLSPLFTVNVANPTTTPAFTFSQVSQNQNLVFASPNGSSGNPTFRALVVADIPFSGLTADNGLTKSAATNVQLGGTLLQNTTIIGAGFYTAFSGGRLEEGKGANVAAANNLTLGLDGNVFSITGNTQINAITTSNWQAGSQIALLFTGTPIVKNNTAGGAGTATILLAGLADFQAAAGDVLTLLYDGTNWKETNRTLASGSPVVTASNGLTKLVNDVQLGGTLTSSTSIDATASFGLTITGTVPTSTRAAVLIVNNTLSTNTNAGGISSTISSTSSSSVAITGVAASGTAISGTSTSGSGVFGLSTNSSGVTANSVNGFGISASSPVGAAVLVSSPATTNTVVDVVTIRRNSSGTPAAGLGGQISFSLGSSNNTNRTSGTIASIWDVATDGSQTASFRFQTVLAGTTGTAFKINGDKSIALTPITATEASAITAADGMLIYVNSTNGTFLSVGIWARENGVWVKL